MQNHGLRQLRKVGVYFLCLLDVPTRERREMQTAQVALCLTAGGAEDYNSQPIRLFVDDAKGLTENQRGDRYHDTRPESPSLYAGRIGGCRRHPGRDRRPFAAGSTDGTKSGARGAAFITVAS